MPKRCELSPWPLRLQLYVYVSRLQRSKATALASEARVEQRNDCVRLCGRGTRALLQLGCSCVQDTGGLMRTYAHQRTQQRVRC